MLALCALAGCGTVSNVTNGCFPYGGVGQDVDTVADCFHLNPATQGLDMSPGRWARSLAFGSYVLLIDLPLSFVGDSLTLPFTAAGALSGGPTHTEWFPPPPEESKRINANNEALPPLVTVHALGDDTGIWA
jgi:uncharacterized protein YceK